MKNIDVCFATDNGYAPFMGVAIQSVLASKGKDEFIRFYILDAGISDLNKQRLQSLRQRYEGFSLVYYPVDMKFFASCPIVNLHLSRAAYARLLLGSLLPDVVQRVIYLDCDVLVRSSLAELFDTNLDGCVVGGVKDWGVMNLGRKGEHAWPFQKSVYINSGVLVIDLARWRTEKEEKTILEYLRHPRYPLQFEDQDAINFALYGKIKILNPRWNGMMYTETAIYGQPVKISQIRQQECQAAIVHFVSSVKPWVFCGGLHPNVKQYQKMLQDSPWAAELKRVPMGTLLRRIVHYWVMHPIFFIKPSFYRNLYWKGINVFF